jgi:hypothetical protein
MMKRIFALTFVVLSMAAAGSAQTAPAIGADGGYQVSFVSPSVVACPAGTACLYGYTLVITPPFGASVTFPPCSATVTGNCLSAASTTFTYRPSGGLYCGTWSATVTANYLDGSGNPVSSVAVPAGSPAVEPCPFVASPVSSVAGKLVK